MAVEQTVIPWDGLAIGIVSIEPVALGNFRIGGQGDLTLVPVPDLLDLEIGPGIFLGHHVPGGTKLCEVPKSQGRAVHRDGTILTDGDPAL